MCLIEAFTNDVQPLLDCSRTELMREWNAVKYALQATRAAWLGRTARDFAHFILESATLCPIGGPAPHIRTLLQIMLVIPASSVQSERDFSVQVRMPAVS